MAQFYLIASLIALVSGPVLFAVSRRSDLWLRVADGFVFTAICGLVAVGILPVAVESAGFGALALAAAGFVLPRLFERNRVHNHRVHAFTMQAVVLGLSLDAVIDGIGLAAPGAATNAHTLPMAILVHRVPVSVAIWWLIRPEFGLTKALISLALIGVATVGGYMLGASAAWLSGPLSGYVVGLIGGFLLHVVLHGFPGHKPLSGATPRIQRYGEGLGALLGLGVLVWTLSSEAAVHGHGHGAGTETWHALYQLGLESAPSLLLAYLLSGLVYAFVPLAATAWMSQGHAVSQALRGMAFGLPIPICSCGVVPLFRTLTQRGVPPAAAMAFLIATPELGLDALILTLPLLGWQFMLVRLAAAAVVALVVGWAISHLVPATAVGDHTGSCACSSGGHDVLDAHPSGGFGYKASQALRLGFVKVVDDTAPWIVAGLVIAATAVPLLEAPLLRQLPDWVEVLAFAALGLPIYVCASGATPIAAVLVAHGVSPGAALAFLLTGPATNVTTFGVIAGAYGRRIAVISAALIASLTIALGWMTNALLPARSLAVAQAHGTHTALWPQLALLGMGLLFLASLVRQGPRSFMHHLISLDDAAGGDHGHDHPHTHSHAHSHEHTPGAARCCTSDGDPEPKLRTIKEFS